MSYKQTEKLPKRVRVRLILKRAMISLEEIVKRLPKKEYIELQV